MKWNTPFDKFGPLYLMVTKTSTKLCPKCKDNELTSDPANTLCEAMIMVKPLFDKHSALSLLCEKVDGHYCVEWFDRADKISCGLDLIESPSTGGPGGNIHRTINTMLLHDGGPANQCKIWYTQVVAIVQAYLGIVFTINTVGRPLDHHTNVHVAPGTNSSLCRMDNVYSSKPQQDRKNSPIQNGMRRPWCSRDGRYE